MGIISETAKIRLWGKNMKHFLDLGYQGTKGDIIDVRIEHLNKKSKALIEVLCDYCGCVKIITFAHYNSCKHSNDLYACTHCVGHKVIETNLERYGVPSTTMLSEIKDKMTLTNLERYGVKNAFQSEIHKEKIKQTMNRKYGVDRIMQSEIGKEKMRNTCIEKYGVSNPAKSQEVKDKTARTNMVKYGGVAPASSPKVREKMSNALYINSSQKVSKQQYYINNLYQGILNYSIAYYNADICFIDEKLDIEYDGGFHNGSVQLGQLTQEEFNHKELIRDRIIKSKGYKIMRIISSTDKLPSDQVLLEMLDYARNYFSLYPHHSWIEFSIDTSSLRNAENRDGIPYSFGELRKIKDSDLPNNNNTNLKGA